MEELLHKTISKKKKRLGQGYGSGKGGHTVGRGQKGQKARGSMFILFEGYKIKKSFIKRLPFRRGKNKNKAGKGPVIVKLEILNILKDNSIVDVNSLSAAGIVNRADALTYGVKVLGNGKLERKLVIKLPISKSAASKVEKVGGKVENLDKK